MDREHPAGVYRWSWGGLRSARPIGLAWVLDAMKLVPRRFPELSAVDRDDPRLVAGWEGERVVFERLGELSDVQGTAVYRRRLRNHPTKMSGEADFVLIIPQGVFVLEVKAARRLQYDSAADLWFDGVRELKETPPDQAEGNAQAVYDWLIEHLPRASVPLVSWGVILVNVDFPKSGSIDLPARAVMCARDMRAGADGMRAYLARLAACQRERWKESAGRGRHKGMLDAAGIRRISELLAPDWDLRPSLGSLVADELESLNSLTREQFHLLHFRQDAQRQIIEGGAGTGKTFLALELANQRAEAGDSVRLIVRGTELARFLRGRTGDGVRVSTVADLADEASRGDQEQAQFLVVDEGQDLFEEPIIEAIEGVLVGGLNAGAWWWFMDSNNQAGLYGHGAEYLKEYLRECATAAPFTLTRNCRNAREIVDYITRTLGTDIGVPLPQSSGPEPVVCRLPAGSPRVDLIELFESVIQEHFDSESLATGQLTIVVVGAISWCEELVAEIDRRLRRRIRRLTIADLDEWPPRDRCVYATAQEIKGLENDRVVVVMEPGHETDVESLVPSLYVALTRARVLLHWIVPDEVVTALADLMAGSEPLHES